MPRPVDQRTAYEPALDGIRALAVAVVVTYHLGVPFTPGGLLGVGVFFTLSGYLITSILLTSWRRTGTLELGTFWIRRAKRLLPALFLVLAVVLLATFFAAPDALSQRSKEALASAFYVSNWATIADGTSYFDRFTAPGPLSHLWSLAIEEQFYVVWPLVLLGLLTLARGRMRAVVTFTLALSVASFVLLAVVASPGFDNTRAYEGTDTRAGGLLIGAVLAMVWQPRLLGIANESTALVARLHHRLGAASVGRVLDVLGLSAIGVILALVVSTDDYSMSLYTWGLLALSLATAVLIAASVHPASRIVRPALSIEPMRWIGERSYGIYLWHLPIVAFTPDDVLADAPIVRGVAQCAVTVGIAALSWSLLEDPIRRFSLRRRSASAEVADAVAIGSMVGAVDLAVARDASTKDSSGPSAEAATAPARPRRGLLTAGSIATRATLVGVVATATLSLVAATGSSAGTIDAGVGTTAADALPPPEDVAEVAAESDEPAPPPTAPTPTTVPAPTSPVASAPAPSPATPVPSGTATVRTSCANVVHVGDSTSMGLNSKEYLPKASDRVDAQYKKVGVAKPVADISGARSIVETWRDQPNARTAVTKRIDAGYDGCWVFAMGTNDSANQAVGSRFDSDERIDRLMKPIDGQPAVWVMVKTLVSKGPYANKNMQKWNAALIRACDRYPTMRVYDWPAQVHDDWYIKDGIHFSSRGYKNRSQLIARSLATAFPAAPTTGTGGPGSANCVVTAP